MRKRKLLTWVSAITLAMSNVTSFIIPTYVEATEQVRVQDDLYQATNREWLESVTLNSFSPLYGNADDIQDTLNQTLFSDLDKMIVGELLVPNDALAQFVTFMYVAGDLQQREQLGATPIRPYFDKIDAIQSLEDLQQTFTEWVNLELALPFSYSLEPDLNDSTRYIMSLDEALLISVGDTLYSDDATYNEYAQVYRDSKTKLLTLMGYSPEVAKQTVELVLQSDKEIEPYVISKEEVTDIERFNNIRTAQEIRQYSKYMALPDVANALVGQEVSQFLVSNLPYFEKLNEFLNPNNLEVIKARMRMSLAQQYAKYLTDEMRVTNEIYANKVDGVSESYDGEIDAYILAMTLFNEPIGIYYGQKYFGEESRQEVQEMATHIIETYKEQLKQNNWLDEKTREGALRKLDTMKVYIGYPDYETVPYSEGVIEMGTSLFDTIIRMKKDEIPGMWGRINAPVARGVWGMAAHEVNAYYTPAENAIYFPAGFLQAPYYSKDQTISEKYAGIGATIGHEITHAFDPSGAKFDEKGNVNNWWTETDLKEYEEKSQAMIDHWNQLSYAGMPINGKLTITENVADAGGLRAALDTLKKVAGDKANMEEFFTNWAKTWREKGTDDYYRTLILNDEHPPSELRANVQAMYLDEFHDTYKTKRGDKMYLSPDKRLKIW